MYTEHTHIHESRGHLVYVYDRRSLHLEAIQSFLSGDIAKRLERIFSRATYVVLGGDGVFIEGAKHAAHMDADILGINFGTKGFFLHDMSALVGEHLDFVVRPYPILRADIEISGVHFSGEAFNEVYLTRTADAGSLRLSLSHARNMLGDIWVDGVMVSTPAGTTGWSRNYGGHILRHTSNENLITPIGNRNISPIILPDKGRIRIINKAERIHPYTLLVDNRIIVEKDTHPFVLTIERAPKLARVLVERKYQEIWDHKVYQEQGMIVQDPCHECSIDSYL